MVGSFFFFRFSCAKVGWGWRWRQGQGTRLIEKTKGQLVEDVCFSFLMFPSIEADMVCLFLQCKWMTWCWCWESWFGVWTLEFPDSSKCAKKSCVNIFEIPFCRSTFCSICKLGLKWTGLDDLENHCISMAESLLAGLARCRMPQDENRKQVVFLGTCTVYTIFTYLDASSHMVTYLYLQIPNCCGTDVWTQRLLERRLNES